jgi:hypothetical protein
MIVLYPMNSSINISSHVLQRNEDMTVTPVMQGQHQSASTESTIEIATFPPHSSRLLDMPIRIRPFLNHHRHAEYAGPDKVELVLSSVQAVA